MEETTINETQTRVAEIALVYRSKVKPADRPKIKNSQDAYQIFLAGWDHSQIELVEQFKILLLNRRNAVLGIYEISSGGTTGTVVDVKLIFVAALKANAHSIILCHNHPSADTSPSEADLTLTRKAKHAGSLLDISVVDHLIISNTGYYSLADEGRM